MKKDQFQLLSLIMVLPLLSSCASAIKKQCEATNWFNHGQSIALKGQRVDEDDFVRQCGKEEVPVDHAALSNGFNMGMQKYCTPQETYFLGKRGEFFNPDMCPPQKALKEQHDRGVNEYCRKSNGYQAGSQGKKYNNICPKDQEDAFVAEFNRGRKKYLAALVDEKEREIAQLEQRIQGLEKKRSALAQDLNHLNAPAGTTISRSGNSISLSKSNPSQEERERDKRDVQWKMDDVDREMDRLRNQQSQIRNKITELRTEEATL